MRWKQQSDEALALLARDVREERLRRRGSVHHCGVCGREFVARAGARTCSTTCRVRAQRARVRNRKGNRMFGIGYEGLTVEELLTRLQSEGADVLVDVRLNAISRKAGFSKRALGAALAAAGIEYVHDPRLGNPRDNRSGYAELDSVVGAGARDRFRAVLDTDEGAQAIRELGDRIADHNVAVLCFEADERHCHREQVIAAVRGARESLAVV